MRPRWTSLKTALKRLFAPSRPFKLTSAGWVFILYTIGVGAGAINTGNNLLYLVFGIFLGLILASGLLSDLSLWNVSIELSLPRSVVADEPVVFFATLRNEKRRVPTLSMNVEVHGRVQGEAITSVAHVPFIAPNAEFSAGLPFRSDRRGWFAVSSVTFQTRYPFNLLRKWWTRPWNGNASTNDDPFARERGFFVFARPVKADFDALLGGLWGQSDARPVPERGDGPVIFGVRDFRHDDNPRRIHWKASAKRSAAPGASPWLVREMEREEQAQTILLLPSPSRVGPLPDARSESLVAFAAAAVVYLRKSGYLVRLAVEGRPGGEAAFVRPQTDSGSDAEQEFLALWDPSAEAAPAVAARLMPGSIANVRPVDVWTAFDRWLKTTRAAQEPS